MPTLSALVSPSTKNPPGSFDFKKTLEPHFPGAYPSDAFAEYSQFRLHPLWHESEKLNRLRERVSGQDNHPIHEKTP